MPIVLAFVAAGLLAGRAAHTPPGHAQGPRCSLRPDKVAAPPAVPLGGVVTVTLRLAGSCPEQVSEADVAVVMDRSMSMNDPDASGTRTKFQGAKAAAHAFLDVVDFTTTRVGLIGFTQDPQVLQPLTADAAALHAAIDGMSLGLGTNLVDSLDAGRLMLEQNGKPGAARHLIFMTDGRHSGRTPPLSQIDAVIAALRQANIQAWAIGFGRPEDVDEAALQRVAGDAAHYFISADGADLEGIYRGIAGRIAASSLLRSATVVDRLPPDMDYVPGSAAPPAAWDAAARNLTWTLPDVPLAGLDLTFQARPLSPGLRATNLGAKVTFTDGLGQPGQATFPVPSVRVLAPTPTPTSTATATATRTATATLTATATPTATPASLYLPRLLRQSCPRRRLEVALVIDSSLSMQAPAGQPGLTKLDAAIAASRALVAELRFPEDRAAVIAFNNAGTVVQGLSASRASVLSALGRLPTGSGTRIDLGLQRAADELAQGRPGARLAVVLLTDGRQDGGRAGAVLNAASRLDRMGTVSFTVGLGADVDAGVLEVIAGRPERHHLAPTTKELEGIYRTIAGELPCP